MATSAATQVRLDAYLAAESEILAAQEMNNNGKSHRLAELKEVQAEIRKLKRDLRREKQSEAGKGSLSFSVANVNKALM